MQKIKLQTYKHGGFCCSLMLSLTILLKKDDERVRSS